ncbi:MAG: ATP-binding protein [Propionibacteriaceae bacterium]|jgi:predicted AAA+ superfamily ATPase|nr:ATP-binding protein [Propionibacteriaceae bacterium]
MLKRKAYYELLAWKRQSQGKTALLVEGARRVGKSTLVEEFGRNEYKTCLVIDFFKASSEVKALFTDFSDDLDALFSYLSSVYGVRLHERESLIVLDEIQFFPYARGLVKYFVEDGRYDFIQTGSLISIKQNTQEILIPSEEISFELNPFDFEEFLWALREEQLAEVLRQAMRDNQPLPDALHKKATRLLREYMLVGGMPAPVAAYTERRDFSAAEEIKSQILALYRNDIARFAKGYEYKVTSVLDQIPGQLSKHEKRFTLSALRGDPRMRTYEEAFFWLADARIANLCFNTTDPHVGLKMSEDHTTLKCYMADTGLLVTQAFNEGHFTKDEVYQSILLGKLQLNEGMLVENLVAQMLKASGRKLWFFSRYGERSEDRLEIDFLISAGLPTRVTPIEVKSTKRYTTTSLEKFRGKFGSRVGKEYLLHVGQLKVEGKRTYLPLYMGWLL